MTIEATLIKTDFDRIAKFPDNRFDHNTFYHPFLMKSLPHHCEVSLEIGCGTGVFTRLLADRSDKVLALDLSPEMIKTAKQRSIEYANIDYQIYDATQWNFPTGKLDAIVSIATMHHLPFKEMLLRINQALKPGGVLVILDLFKAATIGDLIFAFIAIPVNWILTYFHTGRLRESQEIRTAWAEHGKRDSYPSLSNVRNICNEVLPGAIIKRHLLWRYSIIWSKQSDKINESPL